MPTYLDEDKEEEEMKKTSESIRSNRSDQPSHEFEPRPTTSPALPKQQLDRFLVEIFKLVPSMR